MPRKKHHNNHAAAIITILIFLVLLGAAAYLAHIILANAPQPQVAIVTGTVSTLGFATSPVTVQFISGQNIYATSAAYGKYAISLPAPGMYNVQVAWKFFGNIDAGVCGASLLVLPANSQILAYNITC